MKYVKSIRSHAEDLATMQLGYRTERDVMAAQRREIPQLRFTALDRMSRRHNPQRADRFTIRRDPAQPKLKGVSRARERHLAARLAKLEQMGLAQGLGGYTWRVRGNFEHLLRTMQKSSDRDKDAHEPQCHSCLTNDYRCNLFRFAKLTKVEGRVVAHGQDEGPDRPYPRSIRAQGHRATRKASLSSREFQFSVWS